MSLFLWRIVVGIVISMSSWTSMTTPFFCEAFQYQKDTLDNDDCENLATQCASSRTLWFSCPVTCAKGLAMEGGMAEVHDDPEQFFQLSVQKIMNGQQQPQPQDLEDLEGYVTVYAVLPIQYPGMTLFYHELLDHVQSIFPYTVETLLLPYQPTTTKDDEEEEEEDNNNNILSLQQILEEQEPPAKNNKKSSKLWILETATKPTAVLEYFRNAPWVAGNPHLELYEDRVTVFLVTADGMYIERLIAPSMTLLERRISVFLKQMEFRPEL